MRIKLLNSISHLTAIFAIFDEHLLVIASFFFGRVDGRRRKRGRLSSVFGGAYIVSIKIQNTILCLHSHTQYDCSTNLAHAQAHIWFLARQNGRMGRVSFSRSP